MKPINIFTVALLSINMATASCTGSTNESSTPEVERTITLTDNYSGLTTSSGIEVNYTASSTDGSTLCEISGPTDIAQCVNAVVRNSTLYIEINERRWLRPIIGVPVTVTISGRQINHLKAHSGSSLTVGNQLETTENFNIEANSGGIIRIINNGGVTCNNLTVDVSAGGVMTVDNARIDGMLNVDVSSGGRLTMSGKASTGIISASPGAKITMKDVEFSGKVKVNAASGSKVSLSSANAEVSKGPGASVDIYR